MSPRRPHTGSLTRWETAARQLGCHIAGRRPRRIVRPKRDGRSGDARFWAGVALTPRATAPAIACSDPVVSGGRWQSLALHARRRSAYRRALDTRWIAPSIPRGGRGRDDERIGMRPRPVLGRTGARPATNRQSTRRSADRLVWALQRPVPGSGSIPRSNRARQLARSGGHLVAQNDSPTRFARWFRHRLSERHPRPPGRASRNGRRPRRSLGSKATAATRRARRDSSAGRCATRSAERRARRERGVLAIGHGDPPNLRRKSYRAAEMTALPTSMTTARRCSRSSEGASPLASGSRARTHGSELG